MFEELKNNLQQEKKIISDIVSIQIGMQTDIENKNFYITSLAALVKQLALLNDAIPELLNGGVPTVKKRKKKKKKEKTVKQQDKEIKKGIPQNEEKLARSEEKTTQNIKYVSNSDKGKKTYVTINKKDKKEFMEKLKLSEGALAKINNVKKKASGEIMNKPGAYVIFSNKVFRKTSDKLATQFVNLGKDLKKSNSRYMLSSYLSMAIMSTMLSFIFGLFIFAGFMFVSFSNLIFAVVPFGLAGLVMSMFYLYPSGEANSVQKKISQELPFVAIHMAAIAGSNIEPVKIFKIIAASEEYPNIGKELRKVIAQIEIYGYDLVMALKNVSTRTSNKDLAELFSGLATNVSSGGALKNYLEKKAENFLSDYKIERQKYSALAGTFMDVYISILIAAPLILMMMLIVMNVAGLGMGGLSITALLMLSVAGIGFANVVFLVILNAKQPKV